MGRFRRIWSALRSIRHIACLYRPPFEYVLVIQETLDPWKIESIKVYGYTDIGETWVK